MIFYCAEQNEIYFLVFSNTNLFDDQSCLLFESESKYENIDFLLGRFDIEFIGIL